ncbi:head-tail connector protein [Brucella anthropi]|uniref:head-tail connector protein n=1 Tax=Brucella anthropi TaxID=529 RepID=UPI0026719192|nr:head-tail connector protein [Brucella anthropi]WKT91470.1 head-tail connector protein [Brucella anthropi]
MIVDLELMKAQLGITEDMGTIDDALINHAIEAAQDHIERLLGFKIEEIYGGNDQQPIPASLKQAVLLTAASWYENREGVLVGVSGQELPFGVWPIVNEYREWSF